MKKLIASIAIAAGLAAFGATAAHADTTTSTDPCRNEGNGTLIAGNPCAPGTPTVDFVCSHGYAHAIVGPDYCPPPAVVIVGEYELGTTYVPHLQAPTRLDVKMGSGSAKSRAFRCARMGGKYVVRTGVCRGVGY